MTGFRWALTAIMLSAAALHGCKIMKTPSAEETALADSGGFDPTRMAADAWDTKIIPFFTTKATPFAEVVAALEGDVNAVGAKYGHREKESSGPFTFATKLEGVVIAAETKSRSGFVDVDTNADGTADARVQIGPAIKGTAIRDALDFVAFSEFKNQIEWAQYGKALNVHVNETLLSKFAHDALAGKKVKAVGAFPVPAKGELPLVTPVQLTLE